MAALFYIIGGIGIVVGIGAAAVTWFLTSAPDMLARWLVVAPALSVALGALLILAVGGVLSRLDQIAANTGRR